jgi:hypothetical protein
MPVISSPGADGADAHVGAGAPDTEIEISPDMLAVATSVLTDDPYYGECCGVGYAELKAREIIERTLEVWRRQISRALRPDAG